MKAFMGFPVCSLIFISILSVVCFSKKRVDSLENKIYKYIIIANIFGLVLEILCYFSVDLIDKFHYLSLFILKSYVGYILLWCIIFNLYVFITANSINNVKKIKRLTIFSTVFFIFIMSIIYLCPIYIFNEGGLTYTYGPSINLIIILIGIILITWIYMCLKNLKKLGDKSYLPIIMCIILLIFNFLVQSIHREILITTTIHSLVIFIMYFTIENPDIKMINQLELAKDQADKANRAKTDFLSSMSHEIRTPLNAITGFSDCIVNSDTLEEAKTNAKDIIDASNTLLEIVNGILDISKIEAGKLEIVNSQYDAPKLFNNLAKLINPRVNEKGLDFQVSIAPDLPHYLYGDHANLKKVVTNLLSNAAKYTKTGFVKYEVNCVNQENTTRLIISVEDSGQGIKKENIDKLFTKFQRLEEDRNTTIEGTGLGLAITKQLVEMMGGKIIVHSVYGVGSKFTVLLDQKIEDGKEIIEEKQKNISIEAMDLSKYHILIVDDNQLNLKVCSKLLQRYHANVSCLDSGFACLEEIKINKNYDIILMDDMMPKMSGSETFEKLKQIDGFNIPVVALTANAISGMREKYLSIGFDDYLAKPIEKDEMGRVLNELVLNKKPVTNTMSLHSNQEEVDEEIEQLEDESISSISNNSSTDSCEFNGEKFLRSNGVDLDKALEFLGDMEMYNMTVGDYLSEIETKISDLTKYKDTGDVSNYAILVHSMKSDAKYLGLMDFAEVAYQHELKSKANDLEYCINDFDNLINLLRKKLTIIKEYNSKIK